MHCIDIGPSGVLFFFLLCVQAYNLSLGSICETVVAFGISVRWTPHALRIQFH